MMSAGGATPSRISTSDDDNDSQKDVPSGADDPTTTAYKVQHIFDPSPEPSPAPTNKPVSAGFWAEGGEVTSDDDDDDQDLTDVDTDMSHVPKDSPLRIDTKMDTYAEGGEVLDDAMGEELMDAIHKKDKKGIMSAMRAIAMSCKNKEE